MDSLILHDATRQSLDNFLAQPSHALLLVAPTGSGKATIAKYIAGRLAQIDVDKLQTYPYIKIISPVGGKSLSIEAVRALTHFTTLRVKGQGKTSRVGIIEDAHFLTLQAQNALLKTIEEPPAGTVLILTAAYGQALLPTILSRVQQISVQSPTDESLVGYFAELGYSSVKVQKALLMSGGLPGLMRALLEADTEHPMMAATQMARDILQKTLFERLILVESLSKQRTLVVDTFSMLRQMADTSMRHKNTDLSSLRLWYKVLAASYEANIQMTQNVQIKLVLLNFMLAL